MNAHADLRPGFQRLLDHIASRVVPGVSLEAALHDILALGGRQELAFGMKSLTPLQRAVVDELGGRTSTLVDADAATAGGARWYLGQWSYGRIWLAPERPADPECRLLAALSLPAATHDAVVARAVSIQQSWQTCDPEMDAFFDNLDAEGLQRVLHEVHETVDHTDPMLLYVGDDTLTNFGKLNNLQERGADLPRCFHRRAREMARDRWTTAERIYVFCVYWLRRAGCRGEEFCGRQLNPTLLREYFAERLAGYRALAPELCEEEASSIADQARLLARCKAGSAQQLLTYRWINGLTFYKEERVCSRSSARFGVDTLPPALRVYIADACGVDTGQHESLASLFDACVAQMARRGFASDDDKLNAFEGLLKAIVDCAIDATGSDIGMSRGTRDVARMQRAFGEQRYAEICGWQSPDYFCAVFPSAALREQLAGNPELLVKILYACSARMQFNHWHYIPGHCPPEGVPADRHYYYPPGVADLAEWSDQHHTGHVLAQVRYSIRSPAPLSFGGKLYPGMVDLRLFRQSSAPYTPEELMTALTYTDYVRALQQSLSDHLARGGDPLVVAAFGKDWYRDYYGGRRAPGAAVEAASAATGAPAPAPFAMASARAAPSTALFRILCRHAAEDAGHAALIEARQPEPDVTISSRRLLAHAQALRDAMLGGGLAPGAAVAVLSERAVHQTVAIVAGIANGLIVNPLNPALSPQVLRGQMEHAQPAWLIVDSGVAPPAGLPGTVRCIAWDDVFANVAQHEALPVPTVDDGAPREDAGGLLIYTSGTTGASKGVLLSWSNIEANVRYAVDALGFEPGQVTGSLLPRFHTFTLISDLFPALLLGGTGVLADTFDLSNVKWTVDAFVRHGVRSYSAVPVIFDALCALNAWASAPALRMAIAGAAPLKENTRLTYKKAFGHPIIPCYGLSETTCFAAISPPDAIRPGAVGRAAGIEIRVVDEEGAPLGSGVTGELEMRGASVINSGYFHDTDGQFARAFTADGWFKTGDVGRIDDDDYVYVTGRKKNMVIRGGEKVYLEDVDRCLAEFLGVLDCASIVLCQPNEPDLALTFIVTSGSPLPLDEVTAHVRAALSAHHVPDRIYFVERIPRTATGKASHPELLALSKALRSSQEGA